MDIKVLEKETAFFEANREVWLERYEGKWVLVVGEKLEGHFDTFDAAYADGVEKYGNHPMLIKQVLKKEDEIKGHNLAYDLGLIGAAV